MRSTFRIITTGSPPAVAAAFTLGREDVIPDMFRALVVRLDEGAPGRFALTRRYLDRHVDLDEARHAPMARRLLASVCGEDVELWRQAEAAATLAIEARIRLWDEVLAAVRGRQDQGLRLV